ncbi:CG13566 [Drosophila busckii]|uniref:CG13566 n=2 Tax=Drosophila busckii TaxID=30019 RepID=A0A0M4EIL2_DROBS|nr:CG13566 [Drosophila busckii]
MTYYQTCEIILLSCGIVFFVVEGLLIFTTIEQLQDTISDYAYALGIISFSCAALFALDVMLFRQMMAAKNASSQTDLESVIKASNSRGVTTTMRSDRCCAFKQKHNETPLKYLRTDL